jgi:hypothetical protein
VLQKNAPMTGSGRNFQLLDFDEVEQLFLCERFPQNGPTRNDSDVLLAMFLVNGMHQFEAIHTLVLYVRQHKIERPFFTVASKRSIPVRLRHHLMSSLLKHGHDHFLHGGFIFH